MAAKTSLTAIARLTAEHNERQVLAARALENERRVAIVRLVALMLMGLSQGLIADVFGGRSDVSDSLVQPIVTAVYLFYCIGVLIGVHRVRPSLVLATIMPLLATTADVAFVMAMEWCDLTYGAGIELESTAAVLALILSYSILRYSVSALWYSLGLAIVAFSTSMIWSAQFDWGRWTFVTFVYCALTGLLFATRNAVRRAFVDLKRRDNLSRLVAPKVVDEILAGRTEALLPTRREVTVLFSDVRGFTTFSEGRDPEDVLRVLDDYFGRMTQVVQGHDGSVNKFIGDGMLAIWGAPTPCEDHAVRATRAALDMQKVMAEINAAREAMGEPPLRIGIGLHTGHVAAGMLGSSTQAEYTVIGDAVNLASRIEGLTKDRSEGVLVSEATWDALGGRFAGERVGEFTVKGRRAPVVVHAISGAAPLERRAAANG